MSNLTYNPNVNIPYNNNYNNNNINMDFDNSGNFRPSSYDTPQMPQMDPRGNPNIENMRQMPLRQQMRQTYDNYDNHDNYENDYTPKKRKTPKANYDVDTFETKSNKFDWLLFAKKIVIYTALFLIMSHVKMDELVCRFVPLLSDNQILCMTFKGVLLALIIIVIQMIL